MFWKVQMQRFENVLSHAKITSLDRILFLILSKGLLFPIMYNIVS